MRLESIVPWGRSRAEYELMFDLDRLPRPSRILDCGAGPASFTAEMVALGKCVIAVDPLYAHPAEQIRARITATVDQVMDQVLATPDKWVWRFHASPDSLRAHRLQTMERFLVDYPLGVREGRYIAASLPTLPFPDQAFDCALCSHLLFLYSDSLSAAFHLDSVRELARVAGEVRIFPLLDLAGQRSAHLPPVLAMCDQSGWRAQVVKVGYELQRNGNEMLCISL